MSRINTKERERQQNLKTEGETTTKKDKKQVLVEPFEPQDGVVDRLRNRPMNSRRDFLKGMAAIGLGAAVLSTGTRVARADSYGPFAAADLSEEQLIDIYRTMLTMRHWELKDKDEGLKGNIGYPGHLYVGMEASAAGVSAALRNEGGPDVMDMVTATHRGHGASIAKGADITGMFKEQLTKADGLDRGYGGSMHIADKSVGMLGVNSIIGGGVAIAAGAAYGMKVRGTDQVSVTFLGDGAAQSPYFSGALNTAVTRGLPFIAVIENNGYQISASHNNISATSELADLAQGWGIPSRVVDGQDVLTVYGAAKEAVDRARSGGGPTVIETKTYRYFDHSGLSGAREGQVGAFDLPYRSNRELMQWMARDPLVLYRRALLGMGVLNEQRADELEATVQREISEAFDVAMQSPDPRLDEALETAYPSGRKMPATHWFDRTTSA